MSEAWQKKQLDWGLLLPVVALGLIGVTVLYSAAASEPVYVQKMLCIKQGIWLIIGLAITFASPFFSYRRLEGWAVAFYVVVVALLVSVLLWGKSAGGARRWLPAGPVALQPSELAKIAVALVLARYYDKHADMEGLTLRKLVTPIVLTAIPFLLVVRQPDLGTALMIALVAASVTVFMKIERRALYTLAGMSIVMVAVGWLFFLKEYQKERILTFLNPDRDPLGAGYHIIQSKIAIGSGMLFGKGFMKGTQNALSFLPEQYTDFIFSVIAEEWGFIGAIVVLSLYLIIVVWGLSIGYKCNNNFGIIISVGISSMVFWHVAVNVGMAAGLLPVVGVPLPLLSYGGSSVVTFMIGIALLLNISMRSSGVE